MKEYPFHPVAELFPLMEGEEFEAFKEDVRINKQKEEIWLHDGQIIDGRNRYRACMELGIEPKFREWDGDGSLTAFVVSLNLHRRHLNETQRAMLGARVKEKFEEEAKQRMLLGKKLDPTSDPVTNWSQGQTGKSRDKAGELVNVSGGSVARAAKVLNSGVSELIHMADTDQVSVSAAAAVATLPKPEQEQIVKQGPEAVKKRAREVRTKKLPEPKAENGDTDTSDAEDEDLSATPKRTHSGYYPRNAFEQKPWPHIQKWARELARMTQEMHGMGGIQRFARKWPAERCQKLAEQIDPVIEELSLYSRYLKGQS